MIYNLGRVVPLFKGNYDAATTYGFLDVVFYDNSSFVALDTTTGNLPTDTTHWLPVALKGITQNPTQAQMQQIISEVETYMHSTDFVYDADYTHIDVIDNHTSTSTTNALSANQGKVLYDLIDDNSHSIDDLENDVDDLELKKLDKIIGDNLINPSKITKGKFINSSGSIIGGENQYYVSEVLKINGNDMIMYPASTTSITRPWVAYDENMNFTRVAANNSNRQYTFDSTNYPNDYYIRFGFQDNTFLAAKANYGTTLINEPYTDYKPLTDLEDRVEALEEDNVVGRVENLENSVPNKLDKIIGENLINPSAVSRGKFIYPSIGIISNGDSGWFVSDFIPVLVDGVGQNIVSNAVKVSYAGSFVVYAENKTTVRRVSTNTTQTYTYENGDYYVRFGFNNGTQYNFTNGKANYGTTLTTEPYTDYKPLADLENRVEALESGSGGITDLTISYIPNYIYNVYNSIDTSKRYITKLYLSHLLNSSSYKNKDIYFDNRNRIKSFLPTSVETKSETSTTINIIPTRKYNQTSFTTKVRTTNNATSKSVAPRILLIGDSVTSGYGANSNKDVSWLPNQYWAWAKMLFEMDKIDGGDNANEYNITFMGVISSGNFTINYNNVNRSVRCRADGKGGAHLDELFNATWGDSGGTFNPFYDETNQTFSVASYIANYRTMDDLGVRLVSNNADPHGESVLGSDGNTYTIGNKITSQTLLSTYDVCTPTHIFINLVHNTSYDNYVSYIGNVINIIQTELPNIPIVLMVIDETGTYFPCDYQDYNSATINLGSLHTKNCNIYNYIKSNVENEANGIYLLGAQFVQPTAHSLPTIELDAADSVNRTNKETGLKIVNPSVSGATYHPNNYSHAAWGYALYSFIKWIITT